MPSIHSISHSRPKKRQWQVIQSLFFIFIFSLSAFFFLQSPIFRVRAVEINGNSQLSRDQIMALSGLGKDVNIFKANLKLAQSKVALSPIIKHVEISRHLPATIVIDVTERKAIGLVSNPGQFIAIGDDSYCISLVSSLASINLPIITGVTAFNTLPGQHIQDDHLSAALAYLAAMPLDMRAAVSEINVSDVNNIRVFTIDETEVRLGDITRISDKVELYQEVISQKYNEKIQYVDISYKGNPVIKFFR
ncbi:MAG: FtsQ-type POTRA domain-containing protein [Thermincola sp.]|nr:FtsQ-type POTRA domain-containing protein [Thermincola sp.]